MILICPSCTARFVVGANAIGTTGRKVKCAKCAHVWFQEPESASAEAAEQQVVPEVAAIPEEAAPIPEGSSLPVVQGRQVGLGLKLASALLTIAFLFAGSIAGSKYLVKVVPGYYKTFGIYDTEGLAMFDVKTERVVSGKYEDLNVKGVIANESDKEKIVPGVRIILLDESGKKLSAVTLASTGTIIGPGEEIDFENKIPRVPKAATKVQMDLGNSLDLASR